MIKALSYIGKHSSSVLLIGLLLAILLSGISHVFRPALPFLVSLVFGLAIARLNIRKVFSEFTNIKRTLKLLSLVLLIMPIICILILIIWRVFDFDESLELLLVVFLAAPPLSSAASLSLLLGYNARITLQVTLLAQLLTPIIGPLCFSMIDVPFDINLATMALNITLMILGGIILGIAIQKILGKQAIEHNSEAFNGVVAISMVIFLFPLFDGVVKYIIEQPVLSCLILLLSIALNIGGNITFRIISRRFSDTKTSNALGLLFGNRNISIYFAVLPLNPLLSIFIACSQIPMYATPALFGRLKN